MKQIAVCLFFVSITLSISCNMKKEIDPVYMSEIQKFQEELNKSYSNKQYSPLLVEDLAVFKGLDFFPVDDKFRVTAKFIRTPDEKSFQMKTSTERLPEYVKYGEAIFTIDTKEFKLCLYADAMTDSINTLPEYIFLPYTDVTNGNETYGGGRYIDLEVPAGSEIIIDFNKSYNPYCAYSHEWSCPIPPSANDLNIEIKAGVKAFKSVTEH